MKKLIETIPKNEPEEICVSLTEYRGYDLCDVRVYCERYSGDEWIATKKVLSLSVAKLPELIAALQQAEAEAGAAGLLKEDEVATAKAEAQAAGLLA